MIIHDRDINELYNIEEMESLELVIDDKISKS
jgi:hypothetical protein